MIYSDKPLMMQVEERDAFALKWDAGFEDLDTDVVNEAADPLAQERILTAQVRSRPNFMFMLKIIIGHEMGANNCIDIFD